VTKVGHDEDRNRARGRCNNRGKDQDGDEGRGKGIEVPNIYSSKMNKSLCKANRKGNGMVGGQVLLYTHFLLLRRDTKLVDPKPLALNELKY
jgi:hypothetical protein